MGIKTVRVVFSGNIEEIYFTVGKSSLRINEWLAGALLETVKFGDTKILPIHLVLFILDQKIVLEIEGKSLYYSNIEEFYLQWRKSLMIEETSLHYSLILRRIFQDQNWGLESKELLSSEILLNTLAREDPITSLFLRDSRL